jgi:hypothetical protein
MGTDENTPADTTGTTPDAPEFEWPAEWQDGFADLPEVLRAPVQDRVKQTLTRHQQELEEARTGGAPAIDEDWQALLAEAQTEKVSPEDFRQAMQFAATQRQMLQTDPYGYIYGVEQQVDELVRTGQITIAEGKTAKRKLAADAAAAGAGEEDFRTDDQKKLDELQQWREQQEQERAAAAEQEELAELEQQIEDQSEDRATRFITHLDTTLENAGLTDASQATLQAIADVAMGYMARDDDMEPEAAIDKAMILFQEEVTRRKGASRQIPIGGSASAVQQASDQGPQTDQQRQAAMIAAARAAAAS